MDLTRHQLADMYYRMWLIRLFDSAARTLFMQNMLRGTTHTYTGQEAVAIGACAALRRDDYITSTHRGHGHCLAKGGDPQRMMAELLGKATGLCKGKGGSMHITDMSIGMLGANGIVAGGIPIAVGAAYGAAKIRGSDQVAVAFFGDGATNEGPFHEACNMATAWGLPVVFACENNLYGVGTRLGRISASEDVVARAAAYGMPGVTLDGNDVLAVREAAAEAVARARAGGGPSLLECKTWRHKGHFEGENPNYWDETERLRWLAQDPITKYAARLVEAGMATQGELDELERKILERVEEAVDFAETSPDPAPEDALLDVFA